MLRPGNHRSVSRVHGEIAHVLFGGGGEQVGVLGGGADKFRVFEGLCQGGNIVLVRAAAAAEDGRARLEHVGHPADKLLRGAVIGGLAVYGDGHSGVGLGDEGHPGIVPQAAQLFQHLFRAGGAVQAEGADPHALEHHQRGGHVGARQAAPALVAGEGDEDGPVADAADGQHGGPGVGQGHHGLHHEQVHPRLLQPGGLLGIDVHQLLKGGLPQRGQEQTRGGDVPGHPGPALHRLLRQGGQPPVILRRLVENAPLLQLLPVGPEGGGIHHLAARLDIAALNVLDAVRVVQHPLLGAHVALIAPLLQLGPGGTV